VTEHVLELAFTKATIVAAATGFLHKAVNLTEYALYPGPVAPTFFTTTLLMNLNNPPALPGDTTGLTQPGRRLMWVLGSTKFEDHFVVAETSLNAVKMRVSIIAVDDVTYLLSIFPSFGTTWTPTVKTPSWTRRSHV
jgi:hypothetical protein